MPRPVRTQDIAPPGRVSRIWVLAAAMSLTSCPHQGDAARLLWRAATLQRSSKAKRTLRKLVAETATRAPHLTGPQIAAPAYADSDSATNAVEPRHDVGSPPAVALTMRSPESRLPAQELAVGAEPRNVLTATAPELAPQAQVPSVGAEQRSPQSATSPDLHLREREREAAAEPLVFSIARETQIYAEPRFDAKRIGYLRFGASLRRTTATVSRQGCAGGWYGVQPSGFVCANGRTATIDATHPLVQSRLEQPDRMAPLPYAYTIARRGTPRLYGFAPGGAERPPQYVSKRLASALGRWTSTTLPEWWRQPREVFGFQRPKDVAALGSGLLGGGVALLGLFVDAGTQYGVTPDLELVTTDALEPVRASSFAARALDDADSLPVAFAMSASAWLYRGEPRSGNLQPVRRLSHREAVTLTGERVEVNRVEWRRGRDGSWLRAAGMRIVEARTDWPEWARPGQAWVDVSIQQQTLVAYEGTKAAYVTLVSTGVDGLEDPATTKSTKTGVFHIVSKHLTATMNGSDAEDPYEMREVPWVQYFSEGYALHGAYWHDGFGQPRSHGCINLSPIDARWLFHFTHPGLPKSWHGTIPAEPSATVFVHP